ncbi:MAG: cbb3-type cytochrome oxidase assembly protein CcoS [Candidatus Latescibacteria bacterium]|nr:cbb3-type cytochrome oxidase assembly protein CcoS [Candidatus Latescibacterota bacterium]
MSALYLLIGFSLAIALVFLWAFFWAVKNDQYDDTHTPAMRILLDEDAPPLRDSTKELST